MALDYGRSFSLMDTPECPICNERYDDLDDDLIPRNLSCGHSLCSRKHSSCYCNFGCGEKLFKLCVIYWYGYPRLDQA